MRAQEVREHPRRKGEVDQGKSRRVHGPEYMPIRGLDEHKVATLQFLLMSVDLVQRPAAFDPEDFRKVVGVDPGESRRKEEDNGEVVRLTRVHQVSPALQFKHINITQENVTQRQEANETPC